MNRTLALSVRALLPFLALLLPAAGGAGAETVATAEYFPLTPGYSWTYQENGSGSITLPVLPGIEYVNGAATTVKQQAGGEGAGTKVYYSLTPGGLFEHKEFSPSVFIPGVGFQDITVTMSPPMKHANATATPGETISSSGTVNLVFSGLGAFPLNYAATSKFIGFETITVPVGTLRAARYQTALFIDGDIYGTYFSITATQEVWLARFIGVVREITTIEGVQETWELTGINFTPPLTADFTASQASGVSPLAVAFTDRTVGTATGWTWDFGDGTGSTQQNPSHTYSQPGTYTVSLTVSGPNSTSTKTKANLITVAPPPPVAAFSASQTMGAAPLSVQFFDQSTGSVSGWAWDFGDGASSGEQNPVHAYAQPGSYTVSLVATGPGGSHTVIRSNLITVTHPPPVAAFATSQTAGTAPFLVRFSDQSSGTVASWAWSFGDGTGSTLQSPSHTYTQPGTYTVSLTVAGAGGSDTATKAGLITVSHPPPLAAFSADRTIGIAPLTVQFVNQSSGTVDGWSWDFGDTTTTAAQHPLHTFTNPGAYTVTFLVSGPGGTASVTKLIQAALAGADVNRDNTVSLADAVTALKAVTGSGAAPMTGPADIDGDGRTGIGEAVHILHLLSRASP